MSEEELEEIRIISEMYPDGIHKKLQADEMFEKLGYIYVTCEDGFFYYHSLSDTCIHFNTIKKNVSYYDYDSMLSHALNMQELQAINKKVEELGWDE